MITPRRSFLVQVRDGDRVVVQDLRTNESVQLEGVSELGAHITRWLGDGSGHDGRPHPADQVGEAEGP